MNHNHQIYRERRAALLQARCARTPAAASRSCPRRRKSRATATRTSRTGTTAISTTCPDSPSPRRCVALVAGADGDRHVLFCREKNEEREIWDGFRYGPDAAREIFGFDEAHPIARAGPVLPDLASDRPALYTPLGLFAAWDRKVTELLNEVRDRARTGVAAPERDRRRAAGARRDAPRQGRARASR